MNRLAVSMRRPGAAAVEFALVLVLLVPLLLGVWEVGRLINVQQLAISAAREGGRQASTGQKTSSQVQDTVLAYLKNAGLPDLTSVAKDEADLKASSNKVYVQVKVYNTSGDEMPNLDAKDALQNYKVEVLVSFLYRDIRYSPTSTFLSTDTQVAARGYWRCMKDIPVVVNDTIPLK